MARYKTSIGVCLVLLLGAVAILVSRPTENIENERVELELGTGMGSNLMTQQLRPTSSSQVSFEDLIAQIGDTGITMEVSGTTREFRSVLVAGEGCKSYLREGDGEWKLVEEQEGSHSSDPFFTGEGNPFEEGTADPFGNSAER